MPIWNAATNRQIAAQIKRPVQLFGVANEVTHPPLALCLRDYSADSTMW